MNRKQFPQLILASLFGLGVTQAANAQTTIMTFDTSHNFQTFYDGSSIDVSVGGPTQGPIAGSAPWQGFTTGYSNLSNVIYSNGPLPLMIDLLSVGGASVTLNSFDLGDWSPLGAVTGGFGTGGIVQYSIYDLSNPTTPLLLLSSTTDVIWSATSHPTYTVNLSSTAGIRLALSGDMVNNAVDNISFSVTPATVSPVPEPEIYAMMGLGLGLLGWVGRRKKLRQAAAA